MQGIKDIVPEESRIDINAPIEALADATPIDTGLWDATSYCGAVLFDCQLDWAKTR